MKELFTRAQADVALGIALPLAGLILGGIVLAWRKDRRLALLVGGGPLLAGALWWVYNAIADRLGLDTLLNLAVNFALFIAVGVGVGLAWRKLSSQSPARRGSLMDAGRAFDEAARAAELRLAELRRLLAGEIERTPEQEESLTQLTDALIGIERDALFLRNAFLEVPDAPPGFVERGYERLPEGFDPSGWSTETYVTPVTAAWGAQFAEKPGGEITVDSLFEGASESESKNAEASGEPQERTLSLDVDLSAEFADLAPVYPEDPTLLTARDASGAWCVIVDDRPAQAPTLMAFASESERGAWLGRVYASALGLPPETPPGDERGFDEGGPTSRVPVPTEPPSPPGGVERTYAEALAEPRNP